MKVIFLDIDGVLATNKEFATNRTKFREKHLWAKELRVPYGWNKGCVDVFNEILDATNSEIVISSVPEKTLNAKLTVKGLSIRISTSNCPMTATLALQALRNFIF
jgi:hypothetical protein